MPTILTEQPTAERLLSACSCSCSCSGYWFCFCFWFWFYLEGLRAPEEQNARFCLAHAFMCKLEPLQVSLRSFSYLYLSSTINLASLPLGGIAVVCWLIILTKFCLGLGRWVLVRELGDLLRWIRRWGWACWALFLRLYCEIMVS